MPNPGEMAPGFALPDQNGHIVRLADFLGRRVVLYFYPKDSTTACTSQATQMNARRAEIEALGAAVLGVSRDTVQSHEKFAAALELTFPILADPELAVLNAYRVYREKTLYGRRVMGVVRTTFVIDGRGVVEKVFERVKASRSADDVIEYLSSRST
jgi:peroxiredoxin Q/BCP